MRRPLALSPPFPLAALLALAFTAPLAAEDRVTVRTETGAGKAVMLGRVVDWTGTVLRIRSGEEVREFDADRVVDVQTTRLASHLDGLKAFEAGKPDEAATSLATALEQEPRAWMRREILAALVRVELARGRRGEAGRHFLALEASDPATPHFRVIPLSWGTDPPDAALAGVARSWLRTGGSDAAKLLGASVLLFDATSGDEAATVLDDLSSDVDRRIYTLARAQLWRQRLARGKVSDLEIARWADRVNEIPEPLRGGAYYLVGRARAEAGDPEQAAAALLWLPLVYDADASLAAEAAVLAGDELTKIGRAGDAVVLYREAASRFASTPAAAEAKARLARLAGGQGPGAGDQGAEP